MENSEHKYADMDTKELVETIIGDAMRAGTIAYPLRTEGYHRTRNLNYTDRLSY